MANLKQVVYLTQADYAALLNDTHNPKQYTKNGKTIYFDPNTLYITESTVSMSELNGVLPVGKGGTGRETFVTGQVLIGNGSNGINTIAATNSNTANTIIKRDGSGNFSAGTITASLSGNATTSSYPLGFGSRSTTANWGNTTGTCITDWNIDGCEIAFFKNNPSSGKLSVKIDGVYYCDEGAKRVTYATNGTAIGGTTTPVYVDSYGQIQALNYTIAKSVPSDADFTNTWRPIGTGATDAAAGNHTHNYAGSSSAGGAATSANALNFVHTNELLLGNVNGQTSIHINHRRVSGGATTGNTAITDYYFKNGNAAVTGVTVHAGTFDGTLALSNVSGADDLKAIEALSGTSGFLKKTAANTWALDTNTYLTSSTGVTSIAGKTGTVTLADLGLSQALRFIGITSTGLSDGDTTSTLAEKSNGSLIKTTGFVTGDVVIDTNSAYEYVWTGSAWERLGGDSSYKTTQTAVNDPTAATTTSTTFIDTISQNTNGVITATKKTLPTASTSAAGIIKIGTTANDACAGNDSRLSNARTPTSHTHGNIQNGGTLQTNDVTIANGDKLVITDNSDSSKIARASIAFDGSTATKALTQKGTWETFSTLAIGTTATTAAAGNHTHTTTLVSGGTSTVSLSANTAYTLTAGGTSVIFKTPADSDTKNTAGSTNSTSKLFLIGATSQNTNPTTNSYQYTYTNNGLLSSTKLGLNVSGTEKAHIEWNATDLSMDFIFD